jgi:transcriptional regulator with XRE-family HTH domain
MSEQPQVSGVPEFELEDRMRVSMRRAGVGVSAMADYFGVRRETVGTWINGRIRPGTQSLRLWALRTGVPYEWLRTGEVCAIRDSNPEPADYGTVAGHRAAAGLYVPHKCKPLTYPPVIYLTAA